MPIEGLLCISKSSVIFKTKIEDQTYLLSRSMASPRPIQGLLILVALTFEFMKKATLLVANAHPQELYPMPYLGLSFWQYGANPLSASPLHPTKLELLTLQIQRVYPTLSDTHPERNYNECEPRSWS